MNVPEGEARSESACNDAAAYVLGALSCAERQAFEAHLDTCEECRRTLTDFAGLPGLLSRVSVEDLRDPEPVPATLLPRLLAEVRGRSRRRGRALLASAAAVLVLAAGGAFALTQRDQAAPVVGTAMTALAYAPISATAALSAESHGTRIDVVCRYDWNTPAGRTSYQLVVNGRDGSRHEVATWQVGPDGVSRIVGSVDLARDDISTVEVRSATGRPVLRLAVAGAQNTR